MSKKTMLLAGLALAAAALAVPASAIAGEGEWTKNGAPITQNETVEFDGFAAFGNELGTFGCPATAHAILKPGSTGTITSLDIDTDSCTGTGLLTGCELLDDEMTNLPWLIHAKGATTDMVITGVEIYIDFSNNCIGPETELTFEEVTAELDSTAAAAEVTLSGEGTPHGVEIGDIDLVSDEEDPHKSTLNLTPAGVFGID